VKDYIKNSEIIKNSEKVKKNEFITGTCFVAMGQAFVINKDLLKSRNQARMICSEVPFRNESEITFPFQAGTDLKICPLNAQMKTHSLI